VQAWSEQVVVELSNVLTVPRLPELKSSVPVPQDAVTYSEVLHGVAFPDIKGKVELLIGADMPEVHLTLEYRVSQTGGPNAERTPLGWSLVGPTVYGQLPEESKILVSFVQTGSVLLHKQQ